MNGGNEQAESPAKCTLPFDVFHDTADEELLHDTQSRPLQSHRSKKTVQKDRHTLG